MTAGDYLVLIMLALYVVAAVCYGIDGQWGKLLYFLGACLLTIGLLLQKG